MYCNVVTAIDKIPTYLLRFNSPFLIGPIPTCKIDLRQHQCPLHRACFPDFCSHQPLPEIHSYQAAEGVSVSYDALLELFECVGSFLKRLEIYTKISLSPFIRKNGPK